ncbi:DNA polymerase III, delta subunit [Paucidesulfovibrio gracilis DSM 16080]|uniref:DNA polymerase III, delta subunit n=1 Tax=Paucidesulfovibrio gracilis DSM 16080 TaxID=1121449 RepID=A0A1T4X3A5_9BACT|nr:DNA polymerase III subunit delta [Paucidesulfovibrio gracilis]SKA83351.1 DNA polymerase III, delta subunit [Paucidesulfovibrio gracilis DSM 16080]
MAGPDVLFLVCPDGQLMARRIEQQLQQTPDHERKVYWGDDDPPLPESFWQDLTIQNLFATPKVVVLRRAHLLKAADWDRLADALAAKPSSVLPVFCLEGEWKKKAPVPAALARRPLWKAASKRGWVWEQPGLNPRTLGDFVGQWAEERGLKLARGAQQTLAQALPCDARAATLELEKIELAVGDDTIVKPELAALIATDREMDFFAFTDALSQGGDPVAVWERVLRDQRKQSKEQMLFPLLGSLAREARILGLILAGEEQRAKVHPFVVKKKTPLAQRLGPRGVAVLFDLCMAAEQGVKSGERRPDQALEKLVADLTRLYGH